MANPLVITASEVPPKAVDAFGLEFAIATGYAEEMIAFALSDPAVQALMARKLVEGKAGGGPNGLSDLWVRLNRTTDDDESRAVVIAWLTPTTGDRNG